MKLPKIEWPTAAVLVAVIVAIVTVWVTSPDHRGDILAVLGTAGAVVLALMRALGAFPPSPPSGPSATPSSGADGVATKPQRRPTVPPPAARVALAIGLGLALVGCGAGTVGTFAAVGAVVKPIAIGICEAARFTETACERHGAYGPTPETSGAETVAP